MRGDMKSWEVRKFVLKLSLRVQTLKDESRQTRSFYRILIMNGTEEKPGVCDRRNSGFKSLQGSISHSAELRGGITHLSSFRSFLEESASETKPTCFRSTRPPRLLGSSLPVPVFLPLRACTWADPALVISSLCK